MDIQPLQNYINTQTETDSFSGTVLVSKNEKIILESATGFANKEKQILNKIDTKFSLGSANKMFTSVAITQLVDNGLLSFTDKVGKFLPDYPNKVIRDKVTIDQLLTHTSGLGHYLANKKKFLAVRKSLRSIKDFVDFFKNEPLKFAPGTKYEYSGDGYELLGLIIEVITNQNYYSFVKKHIFNAANMPNTDSYELDFDHLQDDFAVGYTLRGDDGESKLEGERRNAAFMSLVKGGAGGGGYSTCHDLLSFSHALLQDKLLSPEMTKLATTPKVEIGTKNGQTLYYGYGFQILELEDGHQRIGHGGAFAGVSTRIDMYPWQNLIVIALSNYDEPSAHQIANKAAELIT